MLHQAVLVEVGAAAVGAGERVAVWHRAEEVERKRDQVIKHGGACNAVNQHTLRLSPDCVGLSVCEGLQTFLDVVLIFRAASHVHSHL